MKIRKNIYLCLLITAAFSVSIPARASAQGYYAGYDGPAYGTRAVDGQVFYYLLPSQDGPVYYNGAVYPTGYPDRTAARGYPYALAPALSVSCTAIPLSARTGEEMLWYSSVTGGVGNYQYFWSGTDGLSARASTVRRSYGTPGEKFATITVTSGGQSITVGCNSTVTIQPQTIVPPAKLPPTKPELRVSCFASPENIAPRESAAWFAVASGISPAETTTYEWQGADGLTGTGLSVNKTYQTEGQKHAILTVTSGDTRAVAACTNSVIVVARRLAAAPDRTHTDDSAPSPPPQQPDSEAAEPIAATAPVEKVKEKENGLLAAAIFGERFPARELAGGDALYLILGTLLAVAVGVILALWRQKQELKRKHSNHRQE